MEAPIAHATITAAEITIPVFTPLFRPPILLGTVPLILGDEPSHSIEK